MPNTSNQRLNPEADETSDDELDLTLVGEELPPFHKVIAQPSEVKALLVVTEKRTQVHAEIAVGHDGGVAVSFAIALCVRDLARVTGARIRIGEPPRGDTFFARLGSAGEQACRGALKLLARA